MCLPSSTFIACPSSVGSSVQTQHASAHTSPGLGPPSARRRSVARFRRWSLEERAISVEQRCGYSDWVFEMACSSSGDVVAAGGCDGKVVLSKRDESGNHQPCLLGDHDDPVRVVLLFDDNRMRLTAGRDKGIKLWNRSGSNRGVRVGHGSGVLWSERPAACSESALPLQEIRRGAVLPATRSLPRFFMRQLASPTSR